jgi:hypothetical protein
MKPHWETITRISALAAFALIGMTILVFATRRGIGLSPDSASYLAMAENLFAGNGLSDLGSWKGSIPAVVFPPLFPAILSFLGPLGVDPVTGARILNTILFGANIFLIGWILWQLSGSRGVAAVGAFFSLSSLCLLQIHSMAWTEPLFIFLALTCLLILSKFMSPEHRHGSFLIGASLFAALAVLTRKAGLALVFTGFFGILAWGCGKAIRRLVEGGVFLSFSFLALGGWSFWKSQAVGGIYEIKTLAFHPFLGDMIRQAASTVSLWFVPEGSPLFIRAFILLAVLFAFFSAVVYLCRKAQPLFPVLISLLFMFIFFHFAVYAGSIAFFANQLIDNRALSPVFASALILVIFILCRLWRLREFSKRFKVLLIFLCGILGISYAGRAVPWILHAAEQGQGYASQAWQTSETMAKVRLLEAGIPLYTNAPDAVYLLAGKLASGLPAKYLSRKLHVPNLRTNIDYSGEWNQMIRDLQNGGALVYFDKINGRWYYPTRKDLGEAFAAIDGEKTSDGIIYRF